jgi:hypothetical protein
MNQAASQAAAIVQAAERKAADMRTAILALSDDLRRMAAYAAENLALPPAMWAAMPMQVAPAPAAPAAVPRAPAVPTAKPAAPAA